MLSGGSYRRSMLSRSISRFNSHIEWKNLPINGHSSRYDAIVPSAVRCIQDLVAPHHHKAHNNERKEESEATLCTRELSRPPDEDRKG